MDEFIWSNTDFPYMCLKDEYRTLAFRKAINEVVKKGDVVLDVGSGSGILSFFAAEAGAKKVYAVEMEHTLAEQLRKSIQLNNLQDTVEVIEGDVTRLELPKNIDVLIAEIIETGLLDELQVPALNLLRKQGVITDKTRIIPSHYKTFVQLVNADNTYYGYQILSPKHEWPFYTDKNTGWVQTKIEPASDPIEIVSADFTQGIIEEKLDITVNFSLNGKKANALKLSGLITLSPTVELGPTNALNGDKIIPIDPVQGIDELSLKISYTMGRGLGNLTITKV